MWSKLVFMLLLISFMGHLCFATCVDGKCCPGNMPKFKDGSCAPTTEDPEGETYDKEKKNCPEKRGDINQCSLNPKNDVDCYCNGECGPCETCVCYQDREGSQYFDEENNCAGLCNVIASECEDCLFPTSYGDCGKCIHPLKMERYNESLTNEKDDQNRKIWVRCNETIDDCGQLQFFARRDETGIYVMMVTRCN